MWPQVANFTNGTEVAVVNPLMTLDQSCVKSTDLENGFGRFLKRTFLHAAAASNGTALVVVAVCMVNGSVPLQLGVDETYRLSITSTQVLISCNTVYGCYHALETLSQLIGFDYDTKEFSVLHLPFIVQDGPRFPHRGLLVDTSRHWLPTIQLKHILDSMTYAKINTLHWHIVDWQAFPFDSPSYPNISQFGAWSQHERYTTEDVADVVEHARTLGVRVMVELDSPGHLGSACIGLPQLCPQPACSSSLFPDGGEWAVDFTKNTTYQIIGNLLQDLAAIFPEKMTHLGGDEVSTLCWSQRPYIMTWLQERNLTLNGGYEYYVKRVQDIAWSMNRDVVGWQEIWDHFGTALNSKTIIHQWLPGSSSLAYNVTSHGYRLIWSDASKWYLDYLLATWELMYDAEPCDNLPSKNCGLVLGGEGCMWGETVDTSDGLQTIWPRLGSVAERLWAAQGTVRNNNTLSRISSFRCLLNERGIPAAPVQNVLARQGPPGPGSCWRQ